MRALPRFRALSHDGWGRLVGQWHRLSPWSRTWLPRGLAAVGYALLALTLLNQGIEGAGGRGGIDAYAYFRAAENLREGRPLYDVPVGTFMAYPYPPILAQLLVPLSYLPLAGFVWVWRALEVVALRVAVGSWTGAGLAILFVPPVLAELDAGNIHLFMAATCALAMRGTAGLVAPTGLMKFASAPLVPLGWARDRRGLLAGLVVAGFAVALSYAADPRAWSDYVVYLQRASFPTGSYIVGENIPLALRLGLAVVVGFAAVKWLRLAPLAVVLAYPVLWFHGLSTLVASFGPVQRQRSTSEARQGKASPVPEARTAQVAAEAAS